MHVPSPESRMMGWKSGLGKEIDALCGWCRLAALSFLMIRDAHSLLLSLRHSHLTGERKGEFGVKQGELNCRKNGKCIRRRGNVK